MSNFDMTLMQTIEQAKRKESALENELTRHTNKMIKISHMYSKTLEERDELIYKEYVYHMNQLERLLKNGKLTAEDIEQTKKYINHLRDRYTKHAVTTCKIAKIREAVSKDNLEKRFNELQAKREAVFAEINKGRMPAGSKALKQAWEIYAKLNNKINRLHDYIHEDVKDSCALTSLFITKRCNLLSWLVLFYSCKLVA